MDLSRRHLLSAAACTAMPLSLLSRTAFASAPGEKRIVVILLRGAMDGLHLLQPYGDSTFSRLRPTLAFAGETPEMAVIDDRFALYSPSGGRGLHDLWAAGELSFIQAVSTPYRGGRSHFSGQDILETGAQSAGARRDGWLPRMLALIPGANAKAAATLSTGSMLLGRGTPSVPNWWPESSINRYTLSAEQLTSLYKRDAIFASAIEEAIRLDARFNAVSEDKRRREEVLAETAARMLNEDVRIAAFSIGGWDTHSSQAKSMFWPTQALGDALCILKKGLGDNWKSTAVLCVTEFGRSVRENGIGGTDHGTGGLAVLSGGAVNGGNVFGDWPGVEEDDLLDGRDLLPTADVRGYIAQLFCQHMGVPLPKIEGSVFPGLSVGKRTELF